VEEETKNLNDYLAILRRRRWQIIVTACLLLAITVIVAFTLPSVYRSDATILIEEQDIPEELVRSTVTGYADQRIQVISQRVMTRRGLTAIIEKYNLYQEERESLTMDEITAGMRDDISLEMVSADVIDPRSGRPQQATIAFKLAFDSSHPQVAQGVTNELVSLFLDENIRERREQAAETTTFFTGEAEKLSQQISELETQLAKFKKKHQGRLPEHTQLNLQLMERTEQQLRDTTRRMQMLDERIIFLSAELRTIQPDRIITDSRGISLEPSERLRALQTEYIGMKSAYSAQHPDLLRLEAELDALKEELGSSENLELLKQQLAEQRVLLQQTSKKYSINHPDVVKLENAVASLEASVKEAQITAMTQTETPENPAYISMQAQLNAVRAELSSTKIEREETQKKLKEYEERLLATPEIERIYRNLARDYEGAVAKYQEIKTKQRAAQVSHELEIEQKAQRFTLIEPPILPLKPSKPNRLAILFLGFVFSIVGGISFAALREGMDRSIQGSAGIVRVLQQEPLGVIPYIENYADKRQKVNKLLLILTLVIVSIVSIALAIHNLWRPLDVLWFSMQNRITDML